AGPGRRIQFSPGVHLACPVRPRRRHYYHHSLGPPAGCHPGTEDEDLEQRGGNSGMISPIAMPEGPLVEVDWQTAKDWVHPLNPGLADCRESAVKERPEVPFWRALYRYGDLIVDGREFQLPAGVAQEAKTRFQKNFTPDAVPLTLVLDNAVE